MMSSQKQEKIIEIASQLFQENSYLSIGVDRIIFESNVAKMTFYKYFPSKEDLIIKVLEQRKSFIINSLEQNIEKKSTPLEKLETIFLWFHSWFFSDNFHGCMFMKAQEEFPSNLKFREINLNYKIWLNNQVESLYSLVGVASPKELASLFIIILDGLTIKANLQNLTQEEFNFSWNILISQIK